MNQFSDDMPQRADAADEETATVLASIAGSAAQRAMHGLSDDVMEDLYAFAYRFYQERKLSEAETFFRFLLMYDFANPDYPFGLAAVYQSRKEYAKAVEFYGIAFAQARDDYRPMLHAGQCYLMMGRQGRARRCFESVVAADEHGELAALARGYLEHLRRTSSEATERAARGHQTPPMDEAEGLPVDGDTAPTLNADGEAHDDPFGIHAPAVELPALRGESVARPEHADAATARRRGEAMPLAADAPHRAARASNGDTWGLAKAAVGKAGATARSA